MKFSIQKKKELNIVNLIDPLQNFKSQNYQIVFK